MVGTGRGHGLGAALLGAATLVIGLFPAASPVAAAAPGSQVVFAPGPGGGPAWQPFATQPIVRLLDSQGAVLTADNSTQVRLTIAGATSANLTCSGGTTVTVTAGIATFTGCQIDLPGTYALTATDLGGGNTGTSGSFVVTPPQDVLVFSTQPGGGSANVAFPTQPVVQLRDPAGADVHQSGVTVTLQLASNPGLGTLSCTGGQSKATDANGTATFAGCKVDRVGNGYTITATGTVTSGVAPSGVTSTAFNVLAGSAAKVAFTTQPVGAAAGVAFAVQPVVAVQDSSGYTVTGSSAAVTLAIAAPPATTGAVLTCTGGTTVAAVNGVATFSGCRISLSGIGYKVTASASGLPVATSNAFTIDPAPATELAFTTQPSASVGANAAFGVQPVVAIRDASHKTTSSTAVVTLTLSGGTPGAALNCTGGTSKAAVAGVAAFTGCAISAVGAGYTITATASGLTPAASNAVTVTPGAPAKLVFGTQPVGAGVSAAFATQPVVLIEDSSGNTVTSSALAVTLSIVAGTGTVGAALACGGGLAPAAVAGVVTYAGCSINKVGTGYKLKATSGILTAATSIDVAISAGAANHLVFTAQPSGGPVSVPFATQPIVAVVDAAGNVVTASSATVTLALTPGTGTAGASVTCAGGTSTPAVGGLAGFTSCAVDRSGTGYTLTASAPGLTAAVSSIFAITAGAPAKLAFSVEPADSVYGVPLSPQPVVLVEDSAGNVVTTSTLSVTLTIGANPTGAKLTCTATTKAAAAGVAAFSGCALDKVGGPYTLTATASGVWGATTSAAGFRVVAGPPSRLAFSTQPGGAIYQTAFTSQPVVAVQDGSGNLATTYAGSVVLSITPGTGSAGAVLSCTGGLTAAVVAGYATFGGCMINRAGTSYSLTATATGVTNATSAVFAVSPGAPTTLLFGTQPAGGSAGTAFTTQPAVRIVDANGNLVTGSSAIVSLSITPSTGTPGAMLSCTGGTAKAAASGVATFAGCAIDLVGASYTLTASSTGLASATSSSLAVSAGPAAKLAFTTQPSGAAVGTDFLVQPVVTIEDAGGNVVSSTASVTLAIASGTGTSGAALTCGSGLTVAASNGVATFWGCRISKVGGAYALKATSGTLAASTSGSFAVAAGAPAKLAVTTQPVGAAYGASFATPPVVVVQDASGNTVTASSAPITVSITIGTGAAGAALTCGGTGAGGRTITAASGVASFGGCSIDTVGSGYTLTFSSPGLTSATSSTLSITPGPPTKVAFTVQPSAASSIGTVLPSQPTVAIEDAAGNVVSSSLGVTLTLTPVGGTPAGASLACTATTKAAASGLAAFAGCKIDRTGSYALTATVAGLTAAVSQTISIASLPPTKVVFSTPPSTTAAAASAFSAQPVVVVQDASGNTVTPSTATVTLSLSGGSGATLSCTGGLAKAAVAGVATFTGCSIDKVGTGYSITATVTGLTTAKSAAMAITAGAGTKLSFTVQPAGSTGGTAFSKQPAIAIQDAQGNVDATSTATVTLAIAAGTGTAGAVLTCTGGLTKAAAKGVATFAGCSIDKTGTGYKLTATSGTLTLATSTAFDISQGPAKQLSFQTGPVGGPGGLPFPTQPIVAIQDAGGATVATSTLTVTIAITKGTGTDGAVLTCDGGLAVAAVDGVATFKGCSIDRQGSGYTLTATAQGLTGGVSKPFDVSAAVAQVKVTPSSSAITQGSAILLTFAFPFGGANKTVELEESTDGTTWRTVKDVVMGADGTGTALYYVTTNRWFRASYGGDSQFLPGAGKAVRVLVRTSTTIRPTNGTSVRRIKRRAATTLTAYVNAGPNVSVPPTKVTFEVYKLVGKKWAFVTRRILTTNSLGRAALRWSFSSTGTWAIRASSAASAQNANSPWSSMERFRVV